MSRKVKCFLEGIMSVFSLNRSSLYQYDDNEIVRDLDNLHPFANDADALRQDFENIGGDIWRAINRYEQQKSIPGA